MQDFLSKLTSRKFLTCVAGIVLGVCMVFGLDQGTVSTIAGAIMSVASIVSYIIAEGKIDAAAVPDVVDKVTDAIDAVDKIKE